MKERQDSFSFRRQMADLCIRLLLSLRRANSQARSCSIGVIHSYDAHLVQQKSPCPEHHTLLLICE